MTTKPLWIAEARVVFVHTDGTRRAGRIAIAAPIVRDLDCACQVALDGYERSITIFGEGTLQALLLAVHFLGVRLHGFLADGGHVLYPDDSSAANTDVDLAVLFGRLLAPPHARE